MVSYHALRSCVVAAIVTLVLAALAWGSAQEIVLYSFTGGTDGRNPYGPVTFDAAGNLYATASGGGEYGHGVVFQLTPNAGGWSYSVLYSFRGTPDGDLPLGQVVFDPAGNIYGTTTGGGAYNCGTVYELSPYYGRWSETVLYNFTCRGKDGNNPQSGLALDAAGNLYGTTFVGGYPASGCFNQGCGTAFKLKPVAEKPWKFVLLHTFHGKNDGGNPAAALTLDAAGNVYGTAMGFGHRGFGTAYQLSYGLHNKNQVLFKVLHSFGSVYDGAEPAAGLVFDATGNAYGATDTGGGDGSSGGTIYQLIPTTHGLWKFNLLYTFSADYTGGVEQSLALDANGNLYGTGEVGLQGGDGDGIFELSPTLSGGWNWSVLYEFPSPAVGASPQGVILDSNGHFFGTANGGGAYNNGVVFEVIP